MENRDWIFPAQLVLIRQPYGGHPDLQLREALRITQLILQILQVSMYHLMNFLPETDRGTRG
ncbi:MAG: hypothetical protein WCF90_02855, partial [Methanomicrobiales archaeon]